MFTLMPSQWNTMNVEMTESGSAVSVTIVVRTFIRKRIRTITTRIAPSRSRVDDVADRGVDEVLLTENVRIHVQSDGQALA